MYAVLQRNRIFWWFSLFPFLAKTRKMGPERAQGRSPQGTGHEGDSELSPKNGSLG